MDQQITIALTGNPNSGKTTMFNNLTGARQHVGNYPGVTVEKKEGELHFEDYHIKVVDLPGTYSLTAYSIEEIIARKYIVEEHPDVVVHIVDGSNLERNLYLTAQLIELKVPLVVALNMADEIKKKGLDLDHARLSEALGAPVIPTIGHRNKGTEDLLKHIIQVAQMGTQKQQPLRIHYGEEIETEIKKVAAVLPESTGLPAVVSREWIALKLLEDDTEVIEVLKASAEYVPIHDRVEISRKHLTSIFGEGPEMIIPEQRYGYVHGIVRSAVRMTAEARINLSDKVDKVLTNRVLGLPIFGAMMYLAFWLVFTVGAPPMDWIDGFFGWTGGVVEGLWPKGSESLLKSLLIDGIIGGVGGVIVFLPNILLLFFAISLLEDTGYMARAAFLMDRLMKGVGLHGKSFIPMLTGFGCSVPAIMGTRCLDNERDRLTTMMVLPLMSCGARLPIYALLIPAFFPVGNRAIVLFSIYLLGIVLAILSAKILRSTLFNGQTSPFVMELPPYRIPTLKAVIIHMWERSWLYLKKAGTIILGVSILLWGLTTFPKKAVYDQNYETLISQADTEKEVLALEHARQAEDLSYTISGRIGHVIEPVIKPLGFDWKIGTALLGALAAKEVFVAQMGIVYSVGEADEGSEGLRAKLRAGYSRLVAFCIMVFCLISAPCIATLAIVKRESNSWKWALFQFGGLTLLAYVLTLIVYQVGSFLQIGVT